MNTRQLYEDGRLQWHFHLLFRSLEFILHFVGASEMDSPKRPTNIIMHNRAPYYM